MTRTEQNIARIQAWLRAKEMRRKDLIEGYGVAKVQIHEALRPGWNPTAALMIKIERAIPDDWEQAADHEQAA